MNLSLVRVGGVCAILTVLNFITTGILAGMSGAGDVISDVEGIVKWRTIKGFTKPYAKRPP